MTNKTLLFAFSMFFCSFFYKSHAQTIGKDEVQLIQQIWGMQKKDLVKSLMVIDPAKASAFWNTYDSYEAERKELSQNSLKLLQQYAAQYSTLTDDGAYTLAKQAISNNKSYESLLNKYLKKFNKVAGGLTATRFIQIENYIHHTINQSIQEEIPFIGDFKKAK